jgi:hypothetical protein
MEKRYQVFVSSTYEDLKEERGEVMQALLALDCIPTGMELFPAADDDSWTLIQRFIAGCDYYVVIVGGRYGSKASTGKSYTEMEYDFAVSAGLPVLAFLHKDPGMIASGKTELTEEARTALAEFRKKIETARHAKYWSSAKDLAGLVGLGMASVMKIKPRVGWVRADLVSGESAAQEILGLRRKIDELKKQIDEAEFTAPAGTEGLAQGEEMISVHFQFDSKERSFCDGEEAFSWNKILSKLGPILIGQASEKELSDKLSEAIQNRYQDKKKMTIYGVVARDQDFQQIKLQLRALGLIREVNGNAGKVGANKSWTLTPHGDRVMTQVAALRSSAKA